MVDFAYEYLGLGHILVYTLLDGGCAWVVGLRDGGSSGPERQLNAAARRAEVEARAEGRVGGETCLRALEWAVGQCRAEERGGQAEGGLAASVLPPPLPPPPPSQ